MPMPVWGGDLLCKREASLLCKHRGRVMYDYVAKIERERAIATPQPCANCDTGNPAITIVFTRSGDLALCESCYND